MAENDSRLYIEWTTDSADPEHVVYRLACSDPAFPDLRAQIGADEVTERSARARLIAAVFERAREMGIDTSRLRFHV